MIVEVKKILIAFIQVSVFTVAGALIAWEYLGIWVIGAWWGSAVGIAVFIASQTDTSPLITEHMKRME